MNRLLKDEEKARLFSKQETDNGVRVGVSSEVQDEILKTKHRTTPNDSNDSATITFGRLRLLFFIVPTFPT